MVRFPYICRSCLRLSLICTPFELPYFGGVQSRRHISLIPAANQITAVCKPDLRPSVEDQKPDEPSHGESTGELLTEKPRLNLAQIQMIPERLRSTLFQVPLHSPAPSDAKACAAHLSSKGLTGFQPEILPVPELLIPPLEGSNVEEHFRSIAEKQIKPYADGLEALLAGDVPPFPKQWVYESGWTKYNLDGTSETVPFPDEDAIVFDVETCLSAGKYATLAAAVSNSAWYSWCSPQLVEDFPTAVTSEGRLRVEHLIPLDLPKWDSETVRSGPWKSRIVIGHNVCFDRSYIREQYLLYGSKMRFFDTMGVHIALAGFTNAQRGISLKYTAAEKRTPSAAEAARKRAIKNSRKQAEDEGSAPVLRWLDVGSLNNLGDVYRLHCHTALPYDKTLSNVFVQGTLDDVRKNFQALMSYCASDVQATFRLAKILYPQFRQALPHPVSFGGMLEMSSAYLPVNNNWELYINKANAACDKIEKELKKGLVVLAKEALEYQKNDAYKGDMWLWDLDWSMQKVTARTKNSAKAQLPQWYRSLCSDGDVDENGNLLPEISLRMRAVPKLMRLTWNGWPLHHTMKYGWGWLEPLPEGQRVEKVRIKKVEGSDQPEKKLTPAEKRQLEAVFPLKKLQELSKSMGRNLKAAGAKCTGNQAQVTADAGIPLSEEDWSQVSDMTPDQQQKFFAEKENEDLGEARSSAITITNTVDTSDMSNLTDDEITRLIIEQVELQEANVRAQQKPKSKTPGGKKKEVTPVDENCYYDVVAGCVFRRLPHANGTAFNVGSPLSRDFLQYFESGILKASFGSASDVIKNSKMVSYWHNNKDRVESQLVGQIDPDFLSSEVKDSSEYSSDIRVGAILPRLVTMGTVTRRAVEATWMTASNAKPGRIGSELKAMIQVPPGHSMVGADVDSQELWIAAVLGDAKWLRQHGCTAFGWMTLQGSKADGTDLHSKTAEQAGISRDHAKILNYGRIYGAGREYAALLMKNFNRELTDADANAKARRIYNFSKGSRLYKLNALGIDLADQCGFSEEELDGYLKAQDVKQIWEAVYQKRIAYGDRKEFSNVLSQLTEQSMWTGGSESYMFNMLESIARSSEPRTPVLGCRVSRCLLKENVEEDFMTSRVNWVVQSSAVDYLHLMLVSMKYFMEKYKIKGRFCLSIHDEVRYIVEEKDRYRCALALHITNLLTRAMFAYKLGINDLPQSVAYFSAVDVDKVMRKEVSADCITPSNTDGLEKTYGVPYGENVDIFHALEKTGGKLD